MEDEMFSKEMKRRSSLQENGMRDEAKMFGDDNKYRPSLQEKGKRDEARNGKLNVW